MTIRSHNSTDKEHIWHPYSAIGSDLPIFHVDSAKGCKIKLKDGRELIDGMSSWWSTIHGYNHPAMNAALNSQLEKMSHVMFGGLTHDPAIELTEKLLEVHDDRLNAVFFADSGSVSVEVAMKMAIQYWASLGKPDKQRFLTVRNGYHGDTFGAMSVCDPVNGMHSLFEKTLAKNLFAPAPQTPFGEPCTDEDVGELTQLLIDNKSEIAAVIIEPIVQGAGGMRFYSADYLNRLRTLCDEYGVLLIFDEIATGFGRTGKMFAYQHTDIIPDIITMGKALTGGYMTLAATMTTRDIAKTIQSKSPGVFMHGPTFMANPLACSAAVASLELLSSYDIEAVTANIATQLEEGLSPCKELDSVEEVRILGAIGVVEMKEPVNMAEIQTMFVEHGIWVRPFGKLVYVMPIYVMTNEELAELCAGIVEVISKL
ncbi:adenosylmethionine--8-amino-7-oxononanoate aminotransferase BioA [Oleiphilus sp. HI0125]|uniref:adenosylmethionine--8-amino-7-oxononanoate transaminase n=2 Tax=Oleiphilus sp. HI0125 TaxID=1822266 RepID=UPI0007C33504|nr:adenosylmethionine--8-amino-7-oxononanoate transaminase [Oleiphilus sp. HI0125]KZZ56836.1 adenosylmethionine--8-amino-7-oxononanoate aminotransferase BioA [Oleiphilus sp. HI0125]